MSMHWTERQHAIANIGAELKRRGWETYDYDPGESDGMTDYYRPASWGGVATHPNHPGVVVCVAVSKHGVEWSSGKNDRPVFHETPKGKAWHIERGGQIVASGFGLEACSHYSTEATQAVAKVCDEIEAAAAGPSTPIATAEAAAGEVHYRVQHDRDWTWVFFTHKPPQAVLEAMHALGARFSGKRTGWYIQRNAPDEEIAAAIQGAIRPAQAPAAASSPVGEEEPASCGFVAGKGSAHDYIPAWMRVPKLYASEKAKEVPLAVIKLFNPDGAWTYYILEWDGQDTIFGLVAGMGYDTELGYASLEEIRQTRSAGLRLQMERDLWFKPTPVTELDEYKEKWGEDGPYNHLQPSAPGPIPYSPANGDGNGDEWQQRAHHFAAQRRRDMGLAQCIVPMGQVEGLPFTTHDDSRIQVYCMGRDVLLVNGEVVTIAGFHTILAWPLIEALQPGNDLLPSDFSYPFEDGHPRQIWSGYIQGVLLDEQQLKDLERNIPQLPGMAQAWPLYPLDVGKDRWEPADIEFLAELLEEGNSIILVDRMTLGVCSIQDFAGMGRVVDEQQTVETDHYTIRFDVGDAMSLTPSGEHRWTYAEVLKGQFPYDGPATAARLRALLAHPSPAKTAAAPAAALAEPVAPAVTGSLPAGWTVEDINYLLEKLEQGPILVSGSDLGIPTIHNNFGVEIDHAGFGLMVGKGNGFTVRFDAGGAMGRTPSGKGWSYLHIEGSDKCPYKYDAEAVRHKLQSYLLAPPASARSAEETRPPAPAPGAPETEPWRLTRLAYQESKALAAGGVPILNGADGEAHKEIVRQALADGKDVPAEVLADYPDLLCGPRPVETVTLQYGSGTHTVYFEGEMYRTVEDTLTDADGGNHTVSVHQWGTAILYNPYIVLDGRHYGEGWCWCWQNARGEASLIPDPEMGENGVLSDRSLQAALRKGEQALGVCFALTGQPADLPDAYPPPPPFKKMATDQAATELLKEAAAIVPEMSGVGDEPAPALGTPNVSPAPAAPAAPWPVSGPDPADQALLKQWSLELFTGRTDKKGGAFYNALDQIDRPGALRLALERIPQTDAQRRKLVANRLEKLGTSA